MISRTNSLVLFILVTLCSLPIQADNTEPLFVVHFETGPAWKDGVAPAKQIGFDKHGKNLSELRKAGVIKFGARYQQYGMIFLSAGSLEDAKAILDADPGIKSGLFKYSVAKMNVFYPWQQKHN